MVSPPDEKSRPPALQDRPLDACLGIVQGGAQAVLTREAVAEAIADLRVRPEGRCLVLDEIASFDTEALERMSRSAFRGLSLGRLEALDAVQARALARGEGRGGVLRLDALGFR